MYFLQVTLAWAVFALFYHGLLRRETFFAANRVYLLLTAAGAWALPLAPSGWWPTVLPALAEVTLPEVAAGQTHAGAEQPVWNALWILYVAGLGLALLRIGWGLLIIFRRMQRAEKQRLSGKITLLRLEDAPYPYSFFHWIFVPASFNTDHPDDAAMLAHEVAHARGGHSLDVLLTELLCAFCWFHPLAYWYRNSLRSVHEYLADEAAARQFSRKQYGLLLIGHAHSGTAPALAHHFFHSPLKKRLLMLTQHASAPLRRLKYALVLPLVVLLASCMSGQKNEEHAEMQQAEKVYELFDIEKLPEFPGGQSAMVKFLGDNLKYPESAQAKKLEGVVMIVFVIDTDGSVTDAQIVKEIGEGCGDEALRVVESMPQWSPAEVSGKPVRCRMTLPVKFTLGS